MPGADLDWCSSLKSCRCGAEDNLSLQHDDSARCQTRQQSYDGFIFCACGSRLRLMADPTTTSVHSLPAHTLSLSLMDQPLFRLNDNTSSEKAKTQPTGKGIYTPKRDDCSSFFRRDSSKVTTTQKSVWTFSQKYVRTRATGSQASQSPSGLSASSSGLPGFTSGEGLKTLPGG